MSPWLLRNYEVFGKFIFVRDNLPLEMYEANNDQSAGLWTRNEHPGNNPEAMRRFQELGELGFMAEKKQEVRQFIGEHPARFLRFTAERAVYFWIAPPQATIIGGIRPDDLSSHQFLAGSRTCFRGVVVNHSQSKVRSIFACLFFAALPASLLSGDALRPLQASNRARNDHVDRVFVLGIPPHPDPMAKSKNRIVRIPLKGLHLKTTKTRLPSWPFLYRRFAAAGASQLSGMRKQRSVLSQFALRRVSPRLCGRSLRLRVSRCS